GLVRINAIVYDHAAGHVQRSRSADPTAVDVAADTVLPRRIVLDADIVQRHRGSAVHQQAAALERGIDCMVVRHRAAGHVQDAAGPATDAAAAAAGRVGVDVAVGQIGGSAVVQTAAGACTDRDDVVEDLVLGGVQHAGRSIIENAGRGAGGGPRDLIAGD